MNNWDSKDEQKKCTIDEDLKSIEMTCKRLEIERIHHLNFQSSYWQRVFSPLLKGYQSGSNTPNPDILCNREIKFGDLFDWTMDRGMADYFATGHYARISNNNRAHQLRQAHDLGKDQTYFLAAINLTCLQRTLFPVGTLMKSTVKTDIVREAGLLHLINRKESMGLCFIGKRRRGKFGEFISNFVFEPEPGRIVDFDTGKVLVEVTHKGLPNYTIGQNVSLSGAKSKMYAVSKNQKDNILLVVNDRHHEALWSDTLKVEMGQLNSLNNVADFTSEIYCTIRSVDKCGVKVKRISKNHSGSGYLEIELEKPVFAPCPGQWAVFYSEDEFSSSSGRICLGGGQIR